MVELWARERWIAFTKLWRLSALCRENTEGELTSAVTDAVLSQSLAVEPLSVTSGHPAASKAVVHLLVESQCPYRYPYLCYDDGETSAYQIQIAG